MELKTFERVSKLLERIKELKEYDKEILRKAENILEEYDCDDIPDDIDSIDSVVLLMSNVKEFVLSDVDDIKLQILCVAEDRIESKIVELETEIEKL